MSINQPEESLEEKVALGLRLVRCAWHLMLPLIFLGFFFWFGSKGDVTIPFFASATISIVLYCLVDQYLKAKIIKFYGLCGKTPPNMS